MRSKSAHSSDGRSTEIRIRDAAITLFAEHGVAATSVRAIAVAAGVAPSLVIHQYGSKEALRTACDTYVAEVLRERKSEGMRSGPDLDPVPTPPEAHGGPPVRRYLARTLIDGSPQVSAMIDELVDDAARYMAQGVESGLLKPSDHPYERAAVLAIWSLGALVLHQHLERLTGADLLADRDDPSAIAAYTEPATEMLTRGIVNERAAHQARTPEEQKGKQACSPQK
ncbi:TetR family transcriptional regulator [Nocardiopsis sp. CNR-923]|uniref:TetR family transcriptional regulator n=1 Tax=Nocardiopsis sp. CNR-923 TaxID=1904965 RepID=UPI0009F97C95|nr:TetR family transcriptional regulator [Nocardiopsis sp. CNR-923]